MVIFGRSLTCPGSTPLGPAQNERHSDSAFGDVALLADEWPVLRPALAAVVRAEHHHRVAGVTGGVECIEHQADAIVHRLDHLAVLGERASIGVQDPQRHVTDLVVLSDATANLGVASLFPRPMRRRVVEMEIEGPRARRRDELRSFLRNDVGVVPRQLHWGLVLPQIGLADGVDVLEVVNGPVEAAEELSEPDAQRAEPGQPSAVPLAEHRRVVAGICEQRWQGGVIGGNAVAFVPGSKGFLQPGYQPAGVASRV